MPRWIWGMLLIPCIALPACGANSSGAGASSTGGASAPTLFMEQNTFRDPNITVKPGGQVIFADPGATGGKYTLYTGLNGQYQAEPGAPADLNNPKGVQYVLTQVTVYTFPTAGTYHITCKEHPGMNATITVTP